MRIEIPLISWKAIAKPRLLAAVVIFAFFFYWLIAVRPYLHLKTAYLAAPYLEVRTDRMGRVAFAPHSDGAAIKEGEILFSLDAEEEKAEQRELRAKIDSLQEMIAFHLVRAEKAMQDYIAQRCGEDIGCFENDDQPLLLLQENQSQANLCKEQLEASKADLEQLQLQLQLKSTIAPFSGVIIKRQKNEGNLVQCGDAIYSFCDPSRPWIEAIVPEKSIAKVALGQQALIHLLSRPGHQWEGIVSWISPIALPNQEGIPVRISFKQTDDYLLPNLSAEVKIKIR